MISRKRSVTLFVSPLVIVLGGMLVAWASGDILATGIAFLITSVVYGATLRYQEKTVRWEHGGFCCSNVTSWCYIYVRAVLAEG
jgi:hypothetical protein